MTSRKLVPIAAFALGVLWLPLTSDAQRSAKTTRIGYLTPSSQPAREEVFRRKLGRLGHTEGPDFLIEYRSANGSFDRLPDLAAELVALKVDVLVVVVTHAALAAKTTMTTIPIVMLGVADPMGVGLVAGVARTGCWNDG